MWYYSHKRLTTIMSPIYIYIFYQPSEKCMNFILKLKPLQEDSPLHCHPSLYLLWGISPYQEAARWMKRFPFCHFPYAKYSRRLHGCNRMGFALADSRFQRGTTNETKAEARRITAKIDVEDASN